jgi:hypothetical protein
MALLCWVAAQMLALSLDWRRKPMPDDTLVSNVDFRVIQQRAQLLDFIGHIGMTGYGGRL